MELDAVQQRVLGCLIEKQRTTPDVYPLSLNALRTACNQATNRDPVFALTDEQVQDACRGLREHELVRIAAAGAGSRATKYRHVAGETLPASAAELALLAVLLLRGSQTVGELRTRTERLHPFASLEEVGETLDGLGRRGLILALEREPGRKESRYAHQLGPRDPEVAAAAEAVAAEYRARLGLGESGGDDLGSEVDTGEDTGADWSDAGAPAPASREAAASAVAPAASDLLARIEALEARVEELEELLSS